MPYFQGRYTGWFIIGQGTMVHWRQLLEFHDLFGDDGVVKVDLTEFRDRFQALPLVRNLEKAALQAFFAIAVKCKTLGYNNDDADSDDESDTALAVRDALLDLLLRATKLRSELQAAYLERRLEGTERPAHEGVDKNVLNRAVVRDQEYAFQDETFTLLEASRNLVDEVLVTNFTKDFSDDWVMFEDFEELELLG
ncbi:hypothetical protein M011DRAFT_456152 [Sporormia fimetaria CBS 119925]|uniref:Uncharacterized protein n=1 Tax=Sporormia fimetaria CBS 119925 TaxID=1340428 RepID=A0A6A6VHY0_9PLEO|nr:hypothetical protein M011DRAFT_456152 [Sporormia fimetaria CBS 119925]